MAGLLIYAIGESVAGEDEREEMVGRVGSRCGTWDVGLGSRTSQHEVAMRSYQAPNVTWPRPVTVVPGPYAGPNGRVV